MEESKPELYEVYSQVLQEAVQRVDLAFKSFFRRVKQARNPVIQGSKAEIGMIA